MFFFVYVFVVFVKVSRCSWYEKVQSLSHQWGCNIPCLDGGLNCCSLKYICIALAMFVEVSLFWDIISCWIYIIIILGLLDLLLTEMVYLQVARILLFVYMFYHVYLHFDQVTTLFTSHTGFESCDVWCFIGADLDFNICPSKI